MEVSNMQQEAQHLVESLPDNATWDDLMYTIYVRQAVESGLEDSDTGRVLDEHRHSASLGNLRSHRTRRAQVWALAGC